MPTMKDSQWLRATFSAAATVDKEAKVLRGMVVAQLGPFKSEGRGRFDETSLKEIVALGNANPKGLKSRFTHPDMSNDGLGKFLGRVKDLRMGSAMDARTRKPVPAVRGDLHFNETALDTPPNGGKPLGLYVMDLAATDPDALSSSIVVKPALFAEDSNGKLFELQEGEEPPVGVVPLWRPRELHASDIVDTGDAVDGLLSAGVDVEKLPDKYMLKVIELLDSHFRGKDYLFVESHIDAFKVRYMGHRKELFGGPPPAPTMPRLESMQDRLDAMAKRVK